MRRFGVGLVAASLALSGCDSILGVDALDYTPDDGGLDAEAGPVQTDGNPPLDVTVPIDTGVDAGADANDGTVGDETTPPDGGEDADSGQSDVCVNVCHPGDTRCAATGVEQCVATSPGCTDWVPFKTCGAHQSCQAAGDGGAAACVCASTICNGVGAACQDQQTLATCSTDTDGCVYVSATQACITPDACSGAAPSAKCSATCTDACSAGQTACVQGELATCTKGSNGCYAYGAPVACGAHQSCTGSAGSASCTCNNAAGCSVVGTVCTSSSAYQSCSKDAQGCWVAYAAITCGTHQSCTGSAGSASCTCNNAAGCTAAGNVCTGNSSYATCSQDTNGCWVESSSVACTAPSGGTVSCSGGSCVPACGNLTYCPSQNDCADLTQNGNCGACGKTCTPGVACTGSQCIVEYGNPTATGGFTSTEDLIPVYFAGFAVAVPQPIKVLKLGMNLHAANNNTNALMALYQPDSGGTLHLIAATAATPVVGGVNELPVTSPVSINSGPYWVFVEFSNQVTIYDNTNASAKVPFFYLGGQTFGVGNLPNPYPSNTSAASLGTPTTLYMVGAE